MMADHYEYINELVQKAQSGNREAMEELYDFYQPLVKAAIRKCISTDLDLLKYKEDLISMAFIEFCKLVDNFDISLSFFSYYISNRLFTNLFKACKELIPRNANSKIEINFTDMPRLWDPETIDPFAQIELEIILKEAISKLNNKHKEAIEFVFYEQYTQEEAASLLGLTQSAFSKRLKKALSILKNNLKLF